MESPPVAIDWRNLFTSIGVAWRDKGSNCVRGNVNISCPMCGNDPSYHLGVSEEIEAYYCYRDSRHKGRSFLRLLYLLGFSRNEGAKLLNAHQGRAKVVAEVAPRLAIAINREWQSFRPATSHLPALHYLEKRGFRNARLTVERYDLRYAPLGKWAGRVLMPLVDNETVLTWTGRAWDNRVPKYLMTADKIDGAVYVPRLPRSLVVLCEGPMDALKIAAATEDEDISAIALVGKGLNASKLLRLARITKGKTVLFCPDADVAVGEAYNLLNQLATTLDHVFMNLLRLSDGDKDPGDMALEAIPAWIKAALHGNKTRPTPAQTHRAASSLVRNV